MSNKISITINPTFKNLIPPLSSEELEQLENNILAAGKIRDPLVLWQGTLIDGHNRYKIAKKHGLDFTTESMNFKDEQEVRIWIIDNQLGRRNLPPYARIELAKMKEPVIKAEAEKRMLAGKSDHDSDPTQKSAEGSGNGETRKQVAALAGVSHDTLKKATEIMEIAPPEILQDLREGKTKINTVYNEVVIPRKDAANSRKESANPQIDAENPRKLSVAEMALGTSRKIPDTPESKAVEREIKENVRKMAEFAKNYKKTIEDFRSSYMANVDNAFEVLAYQFYSTASHLWTDEGNVQVAYELIDETVEKMKKLKEEFNGKFKTKQGDNPTHDPGGIREGSAENSDGEQAESD